MSDDAQPLRPQVSLVELVELVNAELDRLDTPVPAAPAASVWQASFTAPDHPDVSVTVSVSAAGLPDALVRASAAARGFLEQHTAATVTLTAAPPAR